MTEFGVLTKEGVKKAMTIDISKVKSPDPLAYSYGFFQGASGQQFPKDKDLARQQFPKDKDLVKEYIRGFRDGRKKYRDDVKHRLDRAKKKLKKVI